MIEEENLMIILKIKNKYIMKKVIQILVLLLIILVPVILTAQPHPGTGPGGGAGSSPAGGGAPIDGGLFVLLSLAVSYGAKKIYNLRKKV